MVHPLDVEASLSLDRAEAARFEAASGPLFEAFTLFPLHGIRSDGSCACGRNPCKARPGKHPAVRWAEEHYPSGTKRLGEAGIGLATGSRSGGVVVLDLDVSQGKNGIEALSELETVYGRLPPTLTVESPTGGRHLYLRTPRLVRSTSNVLAAGVDVRGEGGYVVVPGSPHRNGGIYRVTDARPIADLPWTLPEPSGVSAVAPVVPELQIVDQGTLRQRLADLVKGKRTQEAGVWRRVVLGERMFRIEGGPGDADLPLIHGVDEYISKSLIWALCNTEDWYQVPAEDFGTLLAPSLAILRQDAGPTSKWTVEHAAEKWRRAQAKVAGAHTAMSSLLAAAGLDKASPLPPALQLDDRYFLLDDRGPSLAYEGPSKACAVPTLASQLWGDRRILEVDSPKTGRRDMNTAEIVKAYGRAITSVVVDYTATTPRLEDHTLVKGPLRGPLPEPAADPEVQAWLDVLDPDGLLLSWIVWAAPEHGDVTVPALAMIGGSHVGKSLLADGLAAAAGLPRAAPLGRALGRFGNVIGNFPILFGDEGLPRDSGGRPLTEEFRALVTTTTHVTEMKGTDKPLIVRGGVRAILAANRLDRLFRNQGNLGEDDVSALLRRLLVLEILDPDQIRSARRAATGLGVTEGDPARLARVARHLRHLQVTHASLPAPSPEGASLRRELRVGGDIARKALEALEDAWGAADWIAVHGDMVWIQPAPWARRAEAVGGSGPMLRALAPYVRRPSLKLRSHPATGAPTPTRPRWVALDLGRLREDGLDLT